MFQSSNMTQNLKTTNIYYLNRLACKTENESVNNFSERKLFFRVSRHTDTHQTREKNLFIVGGFGQKHEKIEKSEKLRDTGGYSITCSLGRIKVSRNKNKY